MLTNAHKLIPGRAGELAHKANTPTFTLLEAIFGYKGPFRTVLKSVGISVNDIDDSYLVLKDGVVYTDIQKEELILWGRYPYKAHVQNGHVAYTIDWSIMSVDKIFNLFVKSIREALIVGLSDTTITYARKLYKKISRDIEDVYKKEKLSQKEFLQIYQDIIYITYLYELFDAINKEKLSTPELSAYLKRNDFMLSDDNAFVEYYLRLDNGFYLDAYPNLEKKLQSLIVSSFIPDDLEDITGIKDVPKQIKVEKELQCMKNNLRLKTNILLYFLNLTMIKENRI